MQSIWKIQRLTDEQKKIRDNLSAELSINPVLSQLLVQRGIVTVEEARRFFRPQIQDLYDPFLMNDMHIAVERLNLAMGRKEKILIYGDYDVDGTTAVALVYKFLQNFYSNLDYYIPDRYDEGYGISYKGIDYAAENDFTLIIALDCGIKEIEKIKYAKRKGVDFIICDHHNPDDELPEAVAVLDAKRADSTYPYQHLSGCGVGFKFMQAFAINNGIDFSHIYNLLDFVAISIASDIVPITDENRILAFYGLKLLNSNPSLGLKGMIELCGLADKEIGITDIVFKIGPRLNASGRIKSGKEAVDLLLTKDVTLARERSEDINQYNQTRKELDKNMTEEANLILENASNFADCRTIVLYNDAWHKGVIGIVASRLTEYYFKPSIVLTLSNGLVTGSARSVPGFDIYKALDACRDILENFGGHTYAAGLSLKESNLAIFKERFEEYVAANILPSQLIPQIDIDAELMFSEITPKFYRVLKQFNPFGPDNNKPIFLTKRVYDYGTSRLVGKDQEHLKLELVDSRSENIMNGIAFGMHVHNDYIKGLNPFDICYTIEENNYNGSTYIQLMIKDIHPSDEEIDDFI